MEIQIPYTILFTISCFLLVLLVRSSSKKSIKNLPPGPWKLPLIGNLHQLAGALPHRSLRDLANKYGPLMHLQLGELSHVVVTSPEMAKEIMKKHDITFANRPSLIATTIITNNTDIAFSPYGNHWRQLRRICTLEVLSARRVQSFRRIREEEVMAFVKYISDHEGSIINLSTKLYELTSFITTRAAFGAKTTENVEEILSTVERLMEVTGGFSIADLYPSLKILQVITGIKAKIGRVNKEIQTMVKSIIDDHKEKKHNHIIGGSEDLVDVLLRIQKENDLEIPLTEENIKCIILVSIYLNS